MAEALEESGANAVENICNVMRLSRGGTLPSQKLFALKVVKKTAYMKLIERLFGGVYQRVLSVHILLQQPNEKLVRIMGVDKGQPNGSESDN